MSHGIGAAAPLRCNRDVARALWRSRMRGHGVLGPEDVNVVVMMGVFLAVIVTNLLLVVFATRTSQLAVGKPSPAVQDENIQKKEWKELFSALCSFDENKSLGPERLKLYEASCKLRWIRGRSLVDTEPDLAEENVQDISELCTTILQWTSTDSDLVGLQDCWSALSWACKAVSDENEKHPVTMPESVVNVLLEQVLHLRLLDEEEGLVEEPILRSQILYGLSRRMQGYLEVLGVLKVAKGSRVVVGVVKRLSATDSNVSTDWQERFVRLLRLRSISDPNTERTDGLSVFAMQTVPTYMVRLRQYEQVRKLLADATFVVARLRTLGSDRGVRQHLSDLRFYLESAEKGLVDIPRDNLVDACGVLAGAAQTAHNSPRGTGKELLLIAVFLMQLSGSGDMLWDILVKARHYATIALHNASKELSCAFRAIGILYHVRQDTELSEGSFELASTLLEHSSLKVTPDFCKLTRAIREAAECDRVLKMYSHRLFACLGETLAVCVELRQIEAELRLPSDCANATLIEQFKKAASHHTM